MDQSVGAAHSGGSCQISLSYDKGQTWAVLQSWQGNCPRVSMPGTIDNHYDLNQNYTFNLPSAFPSGDRVIVAWTWINASGNREYYMSCSCVSILGSSSATITPNGPPLLIANLPAQPPSNPSIPPMNDPVWERCHTSDDTSVIYPLKYQGVNSVIDAPAALHLQPFLGGNESTCGSDNLDMVSALGRFPSGPISSSSSESSSELSALQRRQTGGGASTTIITAEITGGWMYFSLPYLPTTASSTDSASSAGESTTVGSATTDGATTHTTTTNTASTHCETTSDAATHSATTDGATGTSASLIITTSSRAYQSTWSDVLSNGSYSLAASSNSSNWTFTGGPSGKSGSPQSSDASSITLGPATVVTLLAVTTAILVS